jgi:hypothetical protein
MAGWWLLGSLRFGWVRPNFVTSGIRWWSVTAEAFGS